MVVVAFVGGIGGWEILLILAIALVIFGPKRLPEIARGLSKISAQIRAANRQIQREIYSNLDPKEIMRDGGAESPRGAARHVKSAGEDESGGREPKLSPEEAAAREAADGRDQLDLGLLSDPEDVYRDAEATQGKEKTNSPAEEAGPENHA